FVINLVSDFDHRAWGEPIVQAERPTLFVETNWRVELIEPIVSNHALQIFNDVVVDVGWPIRQLHVAAVSVVVETKRPVAGFIEIVEKMIDVRPNPFRAEID